MTLSIPLDAVNIIEDKLSAEEAVFLLRRPGDKHTTKIVISGFSVRVESTSVLVANGALASSAVILY